MHPRTFIPIVLLTSAAVCAGAQADVEVNIIDLDTWSFDITHMPDLDQARVELPGNGSMYCVPTATMNVMAYFAAHGLPALAPGVANWQAESLHGDMSTHIDNLGDDMSTSVSDGTTGDDGHDGTVLWLSGYPGQFNVVSQYQTHDWTPRLTNASFSVMAQGGYVMIGCGWYSDTNPVARGGGHFMTLVSADSVWPIQRCGVRDPAVAEGDTTKQSAYSTEEYGINMRLVRPDWADNFRVMDELAGRAGGTGLLALIDEYRAIIPTFALTDIGPGLETYQPWTPFGGGDNEPGEIDIVAGAVLCDGLLLPVGDLIIKVAPVDEPESSELYFGRGAEPGTWEWVETDDPMFDFVDMTYGRHRSVYFYDENEGLMCYSLDLNQVTATAPPLPFTFDSMAYVDATDEVVLLSIGFDRIYFFDRDISLDNAYFLDLPPSGMEHGTQMEADPGVPHQFWMWSRGATALHRMYQQDGKLFVEYVADFDDPVDAVTVGDDGMMLASINGEIVQYNVSNNSLDPVVGFFSGLPAGSMLSISRSTTNYDPVIHAADDYNVLIEETEGDAVPDCIGDFDFDGVVSVPDLLALLAAWGTADPYVDIAPNGGDETVGVPDLLAVLERWGPCP